MRLKNVPGAVEAVENSLFGIKDPYVFKGKWRSTVAEDKPIYLEIGAGKGQFLYKKAMLEPDNFFIGIDFYASVLIKAVRKLEKEPLSNIKFFRFDGYKLNEIFDKGEIDGIFLNFSDPWPKKRHAKRRLTSGRFLDLYSEILPVGGKIEFKTDNKDLYDFSIVEINAHPKFAILANTEDLHNDENLNAGNVTTEYEDKFSAQGMPIYKIIFELLPDDAVAVPTSSS